MTTATDLTAMLERHYLPTGRPAGGILATEIEAPDVHRRADAIWAPFTIAGGNGLIGHEIKVTRTDIQAELADPTKSEPWAKYCTQWWLTIADPTLIDGLTIPDAWGIMAPPSGRRTRSMTIIRPAPTRTTADTGPAWRRITAWHHHRTAPTLTALQHTIEDRDRHITYLQRRLADTEATATTATNPHATRIGAILTRLTNHTAPRGVWVRDDELSDDDIVTALTDLATTRALTRKARNEVATLIRHVDAATTPLATTRAALRALTPPTTDDL